MMGVCCKNTINVNVFLSTKLNDNHQLDTVDMFHFKDCDFCPPCALAHFLSTRTVLLPHRSCIV